MYHLRFTQSLFFFYIHFFSSQSDLNASKYVHMYVLKYLLTYLGINLFLDIFVSISRTSHMKRRLEKLIVWNRSTVTRTREMSQKFLQNLPETTYSRFNCTSRQRQIFQLKFCNMRWLLRCIKTVKIWDLLLLRVRPLRYFSSTY